MRKGNFLQQDVSRAIRAARSGGLSIAAIVIDGRRVTLEMRDGTEMLVDTDKGENANDGAPAHNRQFD